MPNLNATRVVRGLWRVFFWTVVIVFVVVVGLPCLISGLPFGEFSIGFEGLPGPIAHQRMDARTGEEWPAEVDPADVRKMSLTRASTIDSHSVWYRIELAPAAAAIWRDVLHSQQETRDADDKHGSSRGVEGVYRTVPGPPPLHRQTGSTPHWWTPPAIEFQATERMKWYRGYDSGYGEATYSGFDEASQTLWIYRYGAQHDLLWSRGSLPPGRQFTTIKVETPQNQNGTPVESELP